MAIQDDRIIQIEGQNVTVAVQEDDVIVSTLDFDAFKAQLNLAGTFRELWDEATADYVNGDTVEFEDVIYLARNIAAGEFATLGENPTVNTTHWVKFSASGTAYQTTGNW